MLHTEITPISDAQLAALRATVRGMPRDRHQHGWVEPTGKITKKWTGHYYVYAKGDDGLEKRVHKSVVLGLRSQLSKGKAEEKLRTLIGKATGDSKAPETPATLRWFWENRFRPMREPSWKESTRKELVNVVNLYVLARFGDVVMAKIDSFQVQMHVNTLAATYSRSVVLKARIWTKALLEEAVDQGFIARNPARKIVMPATKKPCKRTLTVAEVQAILQQLPPRDGLMVRICLTLGLRPGEALALRWNDIQGSAMRIDEGTRFGHIYAPKTDASDAPVSMPASIREDLERLRGVVNPASECDLIFPNTEGGVMRLDNVRHRVLVPAAERAGLSGVTFQSLRRTCATMLSPHATVKDIQSHLRHAQASTTLGEYVQAIPASVQSAVEHLDALLRAQAAG